VVGRASNMVGRVIRGATAHRTYMRTEYVRYAVAVTACYRRGGGEAGHGDDRVSGWQPWIPRRRRSAQCKRLGNGSRWGAIRAMPNPPRHACASPNLRPEKVVESRWW